MKHDSEKLQAWAKQALAWQASMDTRWLQLVVQLMLRGYQESDIRRYLQMLAAGVRP